MFVLQQPQPQQKLLKQQQKLRNMGDIDQQFWY